VQSSANFNQDLFDILNLDPTAYDDASFISEFQRIATEMFHNYTFMINGVPHRFTEVEFYLNGGNHPDDFAHDDPIQKQTGSFYFHKMNGKYKAGSFKGMDVTFAHDGFFGGILIRGIQKLTAPRVIVDGPSLVVDHILKTCGVATIPELVAQMNGLAVCDMTNLIHLAPAKKCGTRTVHSSARVGLTLKDFSHDRVNYIARFYRFFTHPKDTKKGKPLMVLALHVQGKQEHEIHLLTGTPKGTVAKYIDSYAQGSSKKPNFFHSKDLSTDDLCLLHGMLYSKHA
jgi:hypothetical protein